MHLFIENELEQISDNFIKLKSHAQTIKRVIQLCIEVLSQGNKIMLCGNGGSAADAQHLAAELIGRYKFNRRAFNAMALTVDTSILTAVGNDYGFDAVFERQIEGYGKAGDVLFGLSTSGNSKNVMRAFELAKKMEITTIALTGNKGGAMKEMADEVINVPSDITNNIQEMHIAVGHLICGEIEKGMLIR